MGRDHFHKVMTSPYFQSHHYKTESKGAQIERKIINFFRRILRKNEIKA